VRERVKRENLKKSRNENERMEWKGKAHAKLEKELKRDNKKDE